MFKLYAMLLDIHHTSPCHGHSQTGYQLFPSVLLAMRLDIHDAVPLHRNLHYHITPVTIDPFSRYISHTGCLLMLDAMLLKSSEIITDVHTTALPRN